MGRHKKSDEEAAAAGGGRAPQISWAAKKAAEVRQVDPAYALWLENWAKCLQHLDQADGQELGGAEAVEQPEENGHKPKRGH